jgi:hypothetical protein
VTFQKLAELSLNFEQIRSRPAFTEEQLVQRALRFLNRCTVASYLNFTQATDLPDERAPCPAPEVVRFAHEKFFAAVKAVMAKDVSPEQREAWRKVSAGVVRIESMETPGAFHYAEGEVFQTAQTNNQEHALLSLVLSWLLDRKRRFGRDLRRCKVADCTREPFFLVGHGKDRRRRYCSPEHRTQVNETDNASRQRDYKARQQAIEILRKKYPKRSKESARAKEAVKAVKRKGLSADELVRLAVEWLRNHK